MSVHRDCHENGYDCEGAQDDNALAETINACAKAEGIACVVDASPARLDRMLELDVPLLRVAYRFRQLDGVPLEQRVLALL